MLKKFILSLALTCTYMGLYTMDVPGLQSRAIIRTTTDIVGSFLLIDNMDLFDHDMICSLGLVNKEWESIVKNAAPKLRARFITKIPQDLFDADEGTIIWHKCGTAFGRKHVVTTDNNEEHALPSERKRITFTLDSIYWKYGDVELYSSQSFYGNSNDTQDIVRPGFNEHSDFSCYGIGGKTGLWNKVEHVVEYRLSRNKLLHSLNSPVHILRCGLQLKKNNVYLNYALSHFVSFPNLLLCFLRSKVAHEMEDFSKLYSLEYAIIPANYQECVPNLEYQSFEDLPEQLKREIVDHYKQQQDKKQQAQNNRSTLKKKMGIGKIVFWR